MRVGVDFGTTHTAVALVDRGNYPVVSFDGVDTVPSLVAAGPDGELRFGLSAEGVRREPGWTILRSFKRFLNEAGPQTTTEIAGSAHRLADLLAGFLDALRRDILSRSNASAGEEDEIEAAVSVPANASSAQRLLTLDAFGRAGFCVRALRNEPSAAAFEYAHRYRATITARRELIAIYDLGGGTFDASLLKMSDAGGEVVASEGIQRLGGDDLDEAILGRVLKAAGRQRLTSAQRAALLEEVRRQKETVGPNTRRLLVDLAAIGRDPVALPVDELNEVTAPLVARTLHVLEEVIGAAAEELAGIYVVGGAGAFPLVTRLLRERWGDKRVKRSPHPFAATAIGLAISLGGEEGWDVADRLSRTFGVFREGDAGEAVVFDPIFGSDTRLPSPGMPPLVSSRRYRAAHNLGHFRFLECSRVRDGHPDGDVTPWGEIRFPFETALRGREDLQAVPVRRFDEGPEVEETYACEAAGSVEVTVRDLTDGFARSFTLGRSG